MVSDQGAQLVSVVQDGSLGDSVSFYPAIRDAHQLSAQNEYRFVCTVSKLVAGDPSSDWRLAVASDSGVISVEFVRFGSYVPKTCNRTALSVQWLCAPLPLFQGWHGLDLEWYVVQTTILNQREFQRSEGSLSLTFKPLPPSAGATNGTQNDVTPHPWDTTPTSGTVRTGTRRFQGREQCDDSAPYLLVQALQIPVASAVPYTRDLLPMDLLSTIDEQEAVDFAESPILIPLQPVPKTPAPGDPPVEAPVFPFTMEVNEACEPPRVRNLRLELIRDPLDTSTPFRKEGFLVLDRTPFLFARVELPALARNDAANSGVVFRRIIDEESGQPEWQVALDLTAVNTAVLVTLPPQATGEEMLLAEKLDKTPATLPPDYVAPTPPAPPAPNPPRLYDFRLGAAARLAFAPTYNPQRYAEIPWNLRRFFGYPGQRDPGAALVSMEFELLYGLGGSFASRDAEITVRVAELFARLGSLPGGLPARLPWDGEGDENSAWLRLRDSWRNAARRFAARLTILQPWSASVPGELMLSKGLEFAPRVQNENGTPIGAQLFFPPDLVGKLTPDVRPLLHLNAQDGLAGGFLFGMQEWEAPFSQLFWDNRRSSSAELRDLAFSSLGGWGQQTARFANNRLLIQARVAMGRTHVYTVERIGKIGVFGHKAKHVIRYERSVVRSPYGVDFIPAQDPEDGRPVLRKMEEYIELIDDRKDYPDHPNGQPLDTGMVQACFFPGKGSRIHIRHNWGRATTRRMPDGKEIENVDWEVPLWRPNADPGLYPKPEIFIEMSSGTGAEARPVAQTIANPEDVYFFTTAQPGLTDDVSQWPIVAGVDYLNAEEPTEWDDREAFPTQDAVPDSGWPGAVSTPPGYERFTFHLDQAQDEINLVANRREDSMLHGRVRNVTMMRSAPKDKPAFAATTASTAAQNDAAANVMLLRKWQRQAHLGLTETRALLEKKSGDVLGRLEDTLAAANRRLPQLKALPAGGHECLKADGTPYPNVILSRAIAAAIDEAGNLLMSKGREYITAAFRPVTDQLHAAQIASSQFVATGFPQQLVDRVQDAKRTLGAVVFYVDAGPEALLDLLDQQLEHVFAAPQDRAQQILDLCVSFLEDLATRAEEFVNNLAAADTELGKLIDRLTTIKNQADGALRAIRQQLSGLPNSGAWANAVIIAQQDLDACQQTLARIAAGIIAAATNVRGRLAGATLAAAEIAKYLRDAEAEANQAAQRFLQNLADSLLLLRQHIRGAAEIGLKAARDLINPWVATVRGVLDHWLADASNFQNKLGGALTAMIQTAQGLVNAALQDLDSQLTIMVFGLHGVPPPPQRQGVVDILHELFCPLAGLDFGLPDIVSQGLQTIEQLGAIKDSWDKLKNAVQGGNYEQALDELDALEHRLGVEASWIGQQILPVANTILDAAAAAQTGVYLAQDASNVLRTVRALCNDLRTDGLGLNRKTVAMILNFRAPDLNLTPALARLNQFGKQLGSLGLRLPVTQLTDRFLPDKSWLPHFDFNRIISDCGGARLAGLLQHLKALESASDQIHVTQGLDRQTLRAWIQAEVDIPIAGPESLFDFGPVSVLLEKARFQAHVRADVDAGGRMTREASGQITADWQLTTGGQELMTFEQTRLSFQDGHMHFDLNPKNVRLGGLLKLVSDLTSLLPLPSGGSDDDGGDDGDTEDDGPLKITLLKEEVLGYKIPAGVRAQLELPAISIGATPVAVTGLQLGGFLELRALQKKGALVEFDFTVSLGLHVSRKDKPFNIAIFCLGGGGWLDAGLVYRPLKSDLTASITVGIVASASLSFDIGWLSGGVAIYFGLFIEFEHSSTSGSTFSIGIMILLRGWVDLLGIVSAQITVLLEAVYRMQDGGGKTLDCTGTVDVSIKICWCFTLSVHRSFTYSMGGGGGGGGGGSGAPLPHLAHHIALAPALAAAGQAVPAAPITPATADYTALAKDYLQTFV